LEEEDWAEGHSKEAGGLAKEAGGLAKEGVGKEVVLALGLSEEGG